MKHDVSLHEAVKKKKQKTEKLKFRMRNLWDMSNWFYFDFEGLKISLSDDEISSLKYRTSVNFWFIYVLTLFLAKNMVMKQHLQFLANLFYTFFAILYFYKKSNGCQVMQIP